MEGMKDWNKMNIEEYISHLEQKFMFDSSGTAKSVFELIAAYRDLEKKLMDEIPVKTPLTLAEEMEEHIEKIGKEPLTEDMKKFLDSLAPQYKEIESDIDFSKHKSYETQSSLHIFEAKYEIDGQKYRTLQAIDSDVYSVEIYIGK